MIKKYTLGEPINTGAVVLDLPDNDITGFAAMKLDINSDSITLSSKMAEDDIIYGLGEQVRGINKRGFKYISNATDEPVHTENKNSLYGAHNFVILDSIKTGLFIDNPGTVVFDIGDTVIDEFVITAGLDTIIYVIEGDSLKDIVKQFRQLIGQSYIPPKWAFGYQQSRWSYGNKDAVHNVINKHHENGIPLDAVYLDIDYMERFKNFTTNDESFPEFEEFVSEIKDKGVHLVPIIDAGVKIEEGYPVYEEGVEKGYFCKDEEGKPFVGAAWPGKAHFPDFLNSKASEWFGQKYEVLTSKGIDGFWNDMNEPALFYSEKNLKATFDEIAKMQGQNIDIWAFFKLRNLVGSLSNNPKDYASFYHDMDGKRIRHDKVHNIYGYYMTKAASEAFDKISPDKRLLLFSRSSYIGMHRYGGMWTGDNNSWWEQLQLSIHQMPSLNMCGMLYSGSDIGGFGSHATEELMMRWLEFGMFTPLMRNHASIGTREQEVYQYKNLEAFKNIIRLRYALVPYIYSEYMKCVFDNEMYIRPLAFDYPEDKFAPKVEDQLMVGESIMIAPVYTQNAKGRYVYLPEEMLMVRMKSVEDKKFEVLSKGHHYVDIALDEVVIFIKKNHILPMAVLDANVKTTADICEKEYEWIGYVDDKAEYELYTDDGISKDYSNTSSRRKIVLESSDFNNGYSTQEKN